MGHYQCKIELTLRKMISMVQAAELSPFKMKYFKRDGKRICINPICQKEKMYKINKYITIIKLFLLYQTYFFLLLQFTYIFATFLLFWVNVSTNHRPAARP